MITITLAHLVAVSGQPAFDMRPLGYGPSDAANLLDALGEEGRAYYLTRQIPLDTLYPALMAATLIAAIRWFAAGRPGTGLALAGVAFAAGAAVADYLENIGILAMLLVWPNLPAALVWAASAASVTKAMLTTLAAVTTLLIAALWALGLRRPGPPPS